MPFNQGSHTFTGLVLRRFRRREKRDSEPPLIFRNYRGWTRSLSVPTPLNEHHEPDLSFITKSAHGIAPHLRADQLVILESTTYPGTIEEILVPILEKENLSGLKAARTHSSTEADGLFCVAFSPEREDPGNTTVARHNIPKVVGGMDQQATESAPALYGSIFKQTVRVSSPAAAEMTKLLENISIAALISRWSMN